MKSKMAESVLVFDIETRTYGKPDREKDRLKLFGCYSYLLDKYFLLTKKEDIQRIINNHKFLVGFNTVGTKIEPGYDNRILEREGIDLKYKRFIDLKNVIKDRAGVIQIKEGLLNDLLMEYSLRFITETLSIVSREDGKKEIDYNVFQKDMWTEEEAKEIAIYTRRDIEVTKKLYEWVEERFESFKDFLTESDIVSKKYLTDAPAVFTYKAMCKELGLQPDFENVDNIHGEYEGGYVAFPAGEMFTDNMALFDFSSLYPNIFIQCNLFSSNCTCCTHDEKWHGKGFFKVDGHYCTKTQGKIEQLYKKTFLLRKQYKKENNPKQYALKIILNAGYGLTGNPKFKWLYNKDAASDCTAIGRQCILYTRKRFRQEGYTNIFTDTDSICVQFPKDKTINDAIELSKKIVLELQEYMPFPW